MLVPAYLYKEELEKEFIKIIYSEDAFYYTGVPHCNEFLTLEPKTNVYRWAVVDKDKNLIGYFAYHVDPTVSGVNGFGLISFKKGTFTIIGDVRDKMEELISHYHRVEWRCIGGNPIIPIYEKFTKKHNGRIMLFKDVLIDNEGKYRDEYFYEIINIHV